MNGETPGISEEEALGQAAQPEIRKGQAEVPPLADVAPEAPDQSHETESKPEKGLGEFLSEDVFPDLEVSEKQEVDFLEKAKANGESAEQIEFYQRSFDNIRRTVGDYFKTLTVDGIFDEREYQNRTEALKTSANFSTTLEYLQKAPFPEFQSLQVNTPEEVEALKTGFIHQKQEVERSILGDPPYFGITAEKQQELDQNEQIKDLQGKIDYIDNIHGWDDQLGAGEDIDAKIQEGRVEVEKWREENTVKIEQAEALSLLKEQLAKKILNHELVRNCQVAAFELILKAGEMKSLAQLTDEEKQSLEGLASGESAHGGTDISEQIRFQNILETAVGKNPGETIYSALVDPNTEGEIVHRYGPVRFIFNPNPKTPTSYFLGDSLGTNRTGVFIRNGIDNPKDGQVDFDHALVAMATRDAYKEVRVANNAPDNTPALLDYIESHMDAPIALNPENISQIEIPAELAARYPEQINGIPVVVKAAA